MALWDSSPSHVLSFQEVPDDLQLPKAVSPTHGEEPTERWNRIPPSFPHVSLCYVYTIYVNIYILTMFIFLHAFHPFSLPGSKRRQIRVSPRCRSESGADPCR